MNRFVLPMALAGALLAARPAFPQESSPYFIRPGYRPPEEVVEVLIAWFPHLVFREDALSGTIMTSVTPDQLEPLETALSYIDVPRTPITLDIYLLWGRDANVGAEFPAEAQGVSKEVREEFRYPRYELANTLHLPTLERSHGKFQAVTDHVFEYWVDRVDPEKGTADLRYSFSRLSLMGGEVATLLEGGCRIYNGKPLALGGVPVDMNANTFRPQGQTVGAPRVERYLILAIQGEIQESSDAERLSMAEQLKG